MTELEVRLRSALADRYQIEREVGRGGMAVVFLAHDRKHDRAVAVKVLQPELGESLGSERFLREIRISANLSHPHIVPLYDSGDRGGLLYYVMPYIAGPSLRKRLLAKRPRPLDEALHVAGDVAEALSYAHGSGVVHRDIKPENVLFAGDLAVVTDFGIARAIHVAGGDALTRSGLPLGTLGYMSPEQAAGDGELDGRTDLYSLGCVLYEMLVGELPRRWLDARSASLGRVAEAPPDHRRRLDALPRVVEQILVRALAQDREQRFRTADEFATALRTGEIAAPIAARHSIAVLPFTNMSADPENEYFSDGIAEEITNALSRVRAMRVAARTSAFQFKGTETDIREIGGLLAVDTVLEGSVRKVGNRLRITAQLVSVNDGCHLWSERYDRELADVFAIQDEIAQSIVQALRVVMQDEDRRPLVRPPTTRVEAYEFYLRGRQFFHQFRRKSLHDARRMFQRAVDLDPQYALAHAGLADCGAILYMYWGSDPRDLEQAETASRRALELDDGLAEAHVSRGLALLHGGKVDEGQREFETAIHLDPNLYEARYFYARACFQQGKLELAAQLFERAAAVRDDFQAAFFKAQCLAALKREGEAHIAYREALGAVQRHLEFHEDDARAVTMGAVSLCRLGRRPEGLEWATRAVAIDPDDAGVSYNVACLYSLEGEVDKAIASLETAIRAGFFNRAWLDRDPDLDPIRDHPRFRALLHIA